MFKPEPMARFRIEIPTDKEDELLWKLGEHGIVEIIQLIPRPARKTTLESECERFLRVLEKINVTILKIPQPKVEKSLISKMLGKGVRYTQPKPAEFDLKLSPGDISGSISKIEDVFEKFSSETEDLLEEYERVQETLRILSILKDNGIDVGDIKEYKFMFVKAGFLDRKLLPKLEVYLEGRVTEFAMVQRDGSDYFVVIVGVKGEEEYVGEVLKLLNFEEVRLPEGLPSKTDNAIAELKKREVEIKSKLRESLKNLLGLKIQVEKFKPTVLKTLKIEREKAKLWRENGKTIIHGWIPRRRSRDLKRIVIDITNREESILIREPIPEITPPIMVENKSPLKDFQLLVNLRGNPNYCELNPTPIVTILYPIMFGMMFGDLGQGLVFLLIGVLLKLSRISIFGLSKHSINRLGGVLAMCGASSMIFGLLYGEFFLMEAFHPLLLSPLHELNKIMAIALAFGVIEIFLGIILGFINHLRQEHKWEAFFGAQGIAGLIYYAAGVTLGIKFLKEGMNIGVFMRNPLLTGIALVCLLLIFIHPVVESLVEGHGEIGDRIMIGFSHALETFMSYLANSVSYIRLAAFAMAHGALAVAAAGLAELAGVFGYVFVNILVIIFEGLASLIQSMRLMYYEFFTKFYSGDGRPFRPFRL